MPGTREQILDIGAVIASMNHVADEWKLAPFFITTIQKSFEFLITSMNSGIHIMPSFIKSHLVLLDQKLSAFPPDLDFELVVFDPENDANPAHLHTRLDPDRVDSPLNTLDMFDFSSTDLRKFSALAQLPLTYDFVSDVRDKDILQTEREISNHLILPIAAIAKRCGVSIRRVITEARSNDNQNFPPTESNNQSPHRASELMTLDESDLWSDDDMDGSVPSPNSTYSTYSAHSHASMPLLRTVPEIPTSRRARSLPPDTQDIDNSYNVTHMYDMSDI